MSEEIIKLRNPYDEDGYTTLQCPFCKFKFKIENNEYIEDEISSLYCPYCGLTAEKSHFFDEDIREQAIILSKNLAIDMVNKMFKEIEQKSKGNRYIKFERGKPIKKEDKKYLFDKFKNAKIIEINCCTKHIKVDGTIITKIYCPYCGEIND